MAERVKNNCPQAKHTIIIIGPYLHTIDHRDSHVYFLFRADLQK